MTSETRESPVATLASTLELAAAKRPLLLDFLLETVSNSPLRFAAHQLASDLGVPLESVALTVYRASLYLDKLEKRRSAWRNPGQILSFSNIAALDQVCKARLGRVSGTARRRRLGAIRRRLQEAHELARCRAWLEAFIGSPFQKDGCADERDARAIRDPRRWIEQFLE